MNYPIMQIGYVYKHSSFNNNKKTGKLMKKKFIISFFFLFIISCIPTANTRYYPKQIPKSRNLHIKNSEPITFTKIIFRIPAGTKIGYHHTGLLKIPRYSYDAPSLSVGSKEFNLIVLEELKKYNYNVLGGESLLFGDDKSSKARFQLGGTITNLIYNTYSSISENSTESSLIVEWQVYDVLKKEVVFKFSTSGYSKSYNISTQAVFMAFRIALHNLMANKEFVELLSKKQTEKIFITSFGDSEKIYIKLCNYSSSFILPNDIESILNGVVTIKVGQTIASGFIISNDGYVLTASHVVEGVEKVRVKLKSNLELDADVIKYNKVQDIALIKLPGSGHNCLKIYKGSEIKIGSEIFAIGTPFSESLEYTVTKGIISGFREIQGSSYIQTDASLNPGNSGGPLLDTSGNVIGIVSWKIVAPGSEGLSFCVPISTIEKRLNIIFKE